MRPASNNDNSTTPEAIIIILNWNGLKDTLECLRSLEALSYPNFSVIVVDNASTEDPTEILTSEFPNVNVLRLSKNLGYAGGNNAGIKWGLEKAADFFWLLNNDTTVPADTLSILVKKANSDQRLGLLSPVIYNDDDSQSIQCIFGYVDWKNFEYGATWKPDQTIPEGASTYLWGTALLIRRDVIERVGLLDEKYFAYAEDRQYCIRAQSEGFEVDVAMDAGVIHKWARASGGHNSPIKIYLAYRNNIFFWKEYLSTKNYISFMVKNIRKLLEASMLLDKKGEHQQAGAYDDALWNGIVGNGGGTETKKRIPWPIRKLVFDHKYFWISFLDRAARARNKRQA